MSYLFVGSTIIFKLYSYIKYKSKKIICNKKQINADAISINSQTIISFYDGIKCIGVHMLDCHDDTILKTGTVDYNYKHVKVCKMSFIDNDIAFATIWYDMMTGDIKKFIMDDIENSQIICEIIINCLWLEPECKQLSIIDGPTELNNYIKEHGYDKNYGHGIKYNVIDI